MSDDVGRWMDGEVEKELDMLPEDLSLG